MRTVWFRSYHRRYFLRKFDFIGRGGNSGREIQYFFEVVCSTIFLYQVRSGYFRADVRHLVYILGFVEILALDAQ
jgi:hypothetical protein